MSVTNTNHTKIERRSFVEVRAQDDEFAIVGYAALYNVESKDLGGFREVVAPGAFDRSLASGSGVYFAFNHQTDAILARTDNQTLELNSDDKGLRFKAKLNPKIQSHRDIYESCKSGLYRECSFAFTVNPNGDKWAGSLRTLTDVKLMDCSLVGSPAYPGTSASARGERIPTAEELRQKAKRLGVFADETAEQRAKLEELRQRMDAEGDPEVDDEADEKDELLDCLQRMCDDRYGSNRYRVVDCDRSEGERCSGTCYMRDLCSETEDFFGCDFDEDPLVDIYPSRALKPQEVSSYRGKRLRFVSNRRRVEPHGTTWSKGKRALAAAAEWSRQLPENQLRARMNAAAGRY